ncbi:MAG TPA: outer membrane protein assembly factor BamA [Candidatus Eisenbacteria bacterium]|nr:outer membrane protein assembly factor BamA [Candidatus Eisenbacteria bacterium]
MTRANPKRFWSLAFGAIAVILFCCDRLWAVPVQNLDPGIEWHVAEIKLTGNERFGDAQLKAILSTKERPWYAPWQRRPVFEPAVFSADLERLKRFYESRGYYGASVSYDLIVDEKTARVVANIDIDEGEPVEVAEVFVEVIGAPELEGDLRSLVPELPLREGELFSEEAYQQSEAKIREYLYDRGRARVEIERRAEVLLDRREARVSYRVRPGPSSIFGETTVTGLKDVAAEIMLRERPYKRGDPFSGQALRDLERNLRQLELFSQIQIEVKPAPPDNPAAVPIEIRVEEAPPREILVGLGYGSEEQLRGQLRWRHNNWLGGGRKLDLGVKVSFIERELNLAFVQPHLLSPKNRLLLNFGPKQFDEPGFFLTTVRLQPRLERKFTERLTGFINYRLDYDQLSDVPAATRRALRDFASAGFVSGLSTGLIWNRTNDPLDPRRGWTLSFNAEQAGGFLGGDFDFFKLGGEGAAYYPLLENTVLASRVRLGFAEPFSGTREVPLFERLFAGGTTSVRGYERYMLGPLTREDDPIGGRSLVEGSIELRHRFTEKIGGAVFLDFGQVSVRSFDLPVDDLRFSAGFGVRYATPVGPLRLDLGFPFRPPPGGPSWQIHFTIGPAF